MQIKNIPFSELPFSDLFKTYVSHFEKLKPFFQGNPQKKQVIKNKTDRYVYKKNRAELVELMKEFNKPFQLHENALNNIEALGKDDTLTVVTGQQMVLGTGPLFTIYKTISAIKYAQRVEQVTGRKTVPVFWLADEDHDFAEIAEIHIPDNNGVRTFEIEEHDEKKGFAVSRRNAGPHFQVFLEWLEEVLPDTEFRPEILNLLNNACKHNCFKASFASILSRLFSKYGLIFAGSDHPGIKKFVSSELLAAVQKNVQSIEELNKQSEKIAEAFHVQAKIQDTLLFFHDEKKGRTRLERMDDNTWVAGDKKFTISDLEDLTVEKPEALSPNVFLRPILQDALLPNIAYVAGPGEIAYYAQMKSLYSVFDQEMPIIVPRLSATLVESGIKRASDELPFAFPKYQIRIEDLEQEFIARNSEDDLDKLFSDWKADINASTEKYTETIEKYDASLKNSAEGMTIGYLKSLDKLYQKLRKSIKHKEDIQLQRIARVKNNIYPNDGLQERTFASLYFLTKYGLDIFDEVFEQLEDSDFDYHKLIFL